MREYESREEAEQDQDLNLMTIWSCDKCGAEREDRPGYNEGGECCCGGNFQYAGESYSV